MSSVVKIFVATLLLFFLKAAVARDIYILVLQETSPAQCKVEDFAEINGIFQVGRDGKLLPARSPWAWANCTGGDILLPIGQELIRQGKAERVIFMPVSAENTKLQDWLPNGPLHQKMMSALNTAKHQNITFDYGFWQGQLIDTPSFSPDYVSTVRRVVKSATLGIKVEKWLTALSAKCARSLDEPALAIRKEPLLNRFSGPDIGVLGHSYRTDICTLNAAGRNQLARLWIDAINKADIASEKYQKESLLYYFK